MTGSGNKAAFGHIGFIGLFAPLLRPLAPPGMPLWREKIFAWMLRNAESAMEFFKLPTNRVVELGSQVEI